MKRMVGVLTCLAVSATLVYAAEPGPYVKLELGPTLVEDVDIKEFFGAAPGYTIEFDPGIRFTIGGGYQFNDFIAVGGETGFTYNLIDNISGPGRVAERDSGIGNIPLMANVVFKLPNRTRVVPFVGAGAGLSFTFFEADNMVIEDPGGTIFVDGSESDTVFAWQLFGGLKYQLNEQMSFGVAYKYMFTDEPDWEADDVFSASSSDFSIEEMHTHAVVFNFTFKF